MNETFLAKVHKSYLLKNQLHIQFDISANLLSTLQYCKRKDVKFRAYHTVQIGTVHTVGLQVLLLFAET